MNLDLRPVGVGFVPVRRPLRRRYIGLGAENCEPSDTACTERNLVEQARLMQLADPGEDPSHFYGNSGYDAYVASENAKYLAEAAKRVIDYQLPDGTTTHDQALYSRKWDEYYRGGLPVVATSKGPDGTTYGFDAAGNVIASATTTPGDTFKPITNPSTVPESVQQAINKATGQPQAQTTTQQTAQTPVTQQHPTALGLDLSNPWLIGGGLAVAGLLFWMANR